MRNSFALPNKSRQVLSNSLECQTILNCKDSNQNLLLLMYQETLELSTSNPDMHSYTYQNIQQCIKRCSISPNLCVSPDKTASSHCLCIEWLMPSLPPSQDNALLLDDWSLKALPFRILRRGYKTLHNLCM